MVKWHFPNLKNPVFIYIYINLEHLDIIGKHTNDRTGAETGLESKRKMHDQKSKVYDGNSKQNMDAMIIRESSG